MLLTTMDSSIALGIVNPAYLRWWGEGDDEEDEADDNGDEDFDDNDTGQQSAPNGQMTWNERRDALLAAITRLPSDVELVLTTTDGTIAFAIVGSQLTSRMEPAPDQHSQIGRNNDWFAAHGWNSHFDSAQGRWERSIEWPARYNEYETVVDSAILVLREQLQVANPNEITVEAF
jgi:hypothetical protein